MATKLDEEPISRVGVYRFHEYNDGNWWLLVRDEDFPVEIDVQQVRESAKAWGRRHSYRLESRKIDNDSIALRFTPVG